MPKAKLTKSFLTRAKPQDKDQYYWDDSITGFGARIYPNGTIKLIFKYESPITKKRVVMVLGKFLPESLEEIRLRATAYRSLVDIRKDPQLEAENKQKIESTLHKQHTSCSVKAMIDKHLERSQHEDRPATRTDKIYMMKRYVIPFIGHMPVHEVYKEDIEDLIVNIKTKYSTPKTSLDRTCNKALAYLSKMFNDAISWQHEWAHIDKNPITYIKIEKTNSKTTYLEKDEMIAVIKVIDEMIAKDKHVPISAFIIAIRLMCGTRPGETVKTLREHIDLENRVWHIPAANAKGKIDRSVPLNDKAHAYFKALMRSHNHKHVFANRTTGKPAGDYRKMLTLILKDAGVKKHITPHDLRRTFGCNLLLSGCDIYTVSKLLGHKSVTVTEQHYAFLNINFLQAEVQKLNKLIS